MGEVREFVLPDLGEGLTEATIVRWLVAVGDTVKIDEPVVEVETAKAMVDVPCPYGGVVTAHMAEEGAEIPVGAPLVTVATVATADAPARPESGGTPEPELEHVGGSGNVLVGYGTQEPTRRTRRTVRPGPGAGTGAGAGAGPGHRSEPAPERPRNGTAPAPADTASADTARTVPVISPLVRRLAREHGLDLRELAGSGPEGLILRADVERALRDRTAPEPAPAPAPAPATAARGSSAAPSGERIPLRGIRGTAAERLSRSRREIPDASCWVDADATELLAARRAMNEGQQESPVSLLALLGRVCTAALARFPALNSTVDTEAREIVVLPEVHLGFAAQTDRGLVVPVVRDAHLLSAEGLGAEMSRLTEAARAGTLTPAELTGGTFTLNNYGVFGVDGSTPIINHPEAAMLGVGRIARKPWVVGDELAVRDVVQLSLTFDHRVCDGGTAGGFLRHVADCVERPAVLLRTL
ncbi:2-oxo acid dehydrogenase subunit E2 [Streptomyces albiaxialis]|uniref:Dihydrolipoamide acetyltransferase component of pyruvate dehydrogenase complex n=1 Tax=Streptomyces albiaxialis TaxID=329523 RepID=A0ABP5HY51_9ACTN